MSIAASHLIFVLGVLMVTAGLVTFVIGVYEHCRRYALDLSLPKTRCIESGVIAFVLGAAFIIGAILMGVDNPSGVDGGDLRQNPTASTRAQEAIAREFDRQATAVNKAVADAYSQLTQTGEASAAFRTARAAELATKIDRIRERLSNSARPEVESTVAKARRAGLRIARRNIRAIGLEGAAREAGTSASFAGINERAIERGALDTLGRLGAAFDDHAAGAIQTFRTLSVSDVSARTPEINNAIIDGLTLGSSRLTEGKIRELFRDDTLAQASYRKLGNKQITVGRHTTNVRTYSRMLMLTRTRELTVAAQKDTQLDVGLDLAQIVGRSSANFCTRFLGLVVVLGQARDGYPSADELPGGLPPFHPNCSKEIVAYSEVSASKSSSQANTKANAQFRLAQRSGLLTTDLTVA